MALNHTPSIVTNGLVFAYDGSNRKSYAGPPITNKTLYISTTGIGTATGYVATEGTEVVTIPQIGPTTVKYVNIQNNYTSYTPNSSNCCPLLFQYGGYSVTGSTLYTYGIVYKVDSGYTGPNYMYRYEYNGATYVTEAGVHDTSKRIYLGDGWWWAWNTFTTQASTNLINSSGLWYYQYSPYFDKISVAKIFVAQGDWTGLHPKYWPECNTTRSNTQAIVDLTNNNTITANSLTYNSDGTFSFNGTANYATLSSTAISGNSARSVFAWVKTTTGGRCIYSSGTASVGQAFNLVTYGSNKVGVMGFNTDFYPTTGANILDNVWHYVGAVADGAGGIKTYVDGNLDNSGSITYSTTGQNNFIGKSNHVGSEAYWNGSISLVHTYNRALSAAEVKQNFNALRGRYGI
jgi:hypothetical protein